MKLTVKHIFVSFSFDAIFRVYQLPQDLRMRKILAHVVKKQKNWQRCATIQFQSLTFTFAQKYLKNKLVNFKQIFFVIYSNSLAFSSHLLVIIVINLSEGDTFFILGCFLISFTISILNVMVESLTPNCFIINLPIKCQ